MSLNVILSAPYVILSVLNVILSEVEGSTRAPTTTPAPPNLEHHVTPYILHVTLNTPNVILSATYVILSATYVILSEAEESTRVPTSTPDPP